MINETRLLLLLCAGILIVAALFKLLNIIYIRRTTQKKSHNNAIEFLPDNVEILYSEAPFEDYDWISKKRSVPNKRIRKSGDFMDFILPYIHSSPHLPESNLSSLSCGDNKL